MMNRRPYSALMTLLGLGASVFYVILLAKAGPAVSAHAEFRTFLPLVQRTHRAFTMDSFQGPELHPAWSWVNENPAKWSLTEKPGFLRIRTHLGGPGEENLLLMPAPTGDYTVSTRVQFDPIMNFQMAGLVFWQDEGNLLMLGPAYCSLPAPAPCVFKGIYFDHNEHSDPIGGNFATATDLTDVYLKVERSGADYTGYYSADAVTWTLVGTHTVSPGVHLDRIGIAAGNDVHEIIIPADFDFYRLERGG
jgi:beta-xylosidase